MRLMAMIRKELRQILRDPRTLAMVVFTPALLLLMFGYVLSLDVKNIKTGILDLDRSSHSRSFISSLSAGGYFNIVRRFNDDGEIDRSLDSGEATVAVVIPAGFGKKLEGGRSAQLQAVIDGSNSQMATIIQGYIKAFAQIYSTKIIMEQLLFQGYDRLPIPVQIEARLWYNPELKSSVFLIPGLMVFILMITCTISTALSIVRERERGTIEQLLVSPLTSPQITLGKTVPYIFIALISTCIILAVGNIAFSVQVKGGYLMLFVSSILFIFSALGQGIFISTVTKSQQVAYFAAALSSILPSFLLSGFVFPIRNMPYAIQLVTYVVPARYFVVLLRSILIKGVGIEAYWKELIALALFSLLMLGASTARMSRARLT
jgi:ABC-2 type transport system permease protein